MRIKANYLKTALPALLLVTGILCFGNTLWIAAKAVLAQRLIADAWEETLATGHSVKPWSWSDTWPVAVLTFPGHNQRLYMLSGGHGSSLAFGPGHIDGTALPGESGTQVYSGHRDTHFNFLQHVHTGDTFQIQDSHGQWRTYRVSKTNIVDSHTHRWFIERNKNEIQLITCYPFNDMTPNPRLRLIVLAVPV